MGTKRNMERALVASVLVAVVCAGCGDDDVTGLDGGPVPDGAAADAPSVMDGGLDGGSVGDSGADATTPDGGAPGCVTSYLVATTTSLAFDANGLAALALGSGVVDEAAMGPGDSDAVVVSSGCRAFLLERGNGIVRVQATGSPLDSSVSFDVDPASSKGNYVSNPVAVVSSRARRRTS